MRRSSRRRRLRRVRLAMPMFRIEGRIRVMSHGTKQRAASKWVVVQGREFKQRECRMTLMVT